MLLSLRSIARFYGPRLIFKNVSFDVAPGSITLLAGANGAGKSTLLKIMAGLIRPSAGELHFGSPDIETPNIGYLGHQTFLYPDLTALENLRFWAGMQGVSLADEHYHAALERVELAPFAEEKARVFSRGMAQRLNLARVFLQAPDILLLDEPGTGLDTRSAAVLAQEVRAAKERGTGIVWISHSLDQDAPMADAIAFLAQKKLAFHGSYADFLDFCSTTSDVAGSSRKSTQTPIDPPPFATREARGGEAC